ncbi:hypothetical protein H696_01005 [Fonticula alba]|uniref:Uncharacterized protein n=1 Tax=Fonticula alba TaxID=691883 RepID=A0A058ZHP2_FONAL|nr:hypothetical protein H696_01005 [Fonticula alba]KCV73466.1 hypothetical protein H696_01005 [Fonticula alba]|eukprot:XP_009493167.1 hypothetical protein H696_01005 [Fonticula alba]
MRGGRRAGGGGGMSSGSRGTTSSSSSSGSSYRRRQTYSSGGSSSSSSDSCCCPPEASHNLFCFVFFCFCITDIFHRPDFVHRHRRICVAAFWIGLLLTPVAMSVCLSTVPLYTSRSWSFQPSGTFKTSVHPFFYEEVSPLSGSSVETYLIPASEGPVKRVSQLTGDMVSEMKSPSSQYYRAMEVYLPAGSELVSVLSGDVPCPLDYIIIRGDSNFEDWASGYKVPEEFHGIVLPNQPLLHVLLTGTSDTFFFVVFNDSNYPCPKPPLFMQLSLNAPAYRLPPSHRLTRGQAAPVPADHRGKASIIFHTPHELKYHDVQVKYSKRPGSLGLVLGLGISLPFVLGLIVMFISWVVYRVEARRNWRHIGGHTWVRLDGGAGKVATEPLLAGGSAPMTSEPSDDISSASKVAKTPKPVFLDGPRAPAESRRFSTSSADPIPTWVFGGEESTSASASSSSLALSEAGYDSELTSSVVTPFRPADDLHLAHVAPYQAMDNVPLEQVMREAPPSYSATVLPSSTDGWSKY